jgi:tRNA pseudouridine55 synthase
LPETGTAPRHGFIRSDKPAGVTSHDVVARHRREVEGRVGHAGTLDPFATGLLIVLVGAGTRLQRYVLGLPKTYVATARLGWTSTTGDPEGELTETGRLPDRLELPTGRISQVPPMTSAVKQGGERLYAKARRGEVVERPPREVEVYRAALIADEGETATFEIECSSGTYVRTLIETLGDAYCESLRRVAVGDLRIEPTGGDGPLEPLDALVAHLPAIELGPDDERRLRHGVRIPAPAAAAAVSDHRDGPIRLLGPDGLFAVARVREGELVTEVVLPADDGIAGPD